VSKAEKSSYPVEIVIPRFKQTDADEKQRHSKDYNLLRAAELKHPYTRMTGMVLDLPADPQIGVIELVQFF
jgi:hypothetical protein